MSITATGISKTFGRFAALDNVSLSVPAGRLVALLGPSGSGKTTLLRIIAGLEFPDAGGGRVTFHGEDVTRLPAGKRGVGFVFQHYALFRHMTVFENIAFGLRVRPRARRPARAEIAARVNELLHLVQLDGLDRRFPSQLSGGQRQRVALARALAVRPRVLLLDEPFGALDAKVRKELRRWLRKFHEEIQLTTVFVTHDQEEALEIADEVVIMNQARIEQTGAPRDIYDRPATPFVHKFIGDVNILRDTAAWAAAGPIHDNGRLAADGLVYARPHEIEVLPHDPAAAGIAAVLRHAHTAGPHPRLTLEILSTREQVEAEITRDELAALNLRPNDPARLRLRPAHTFQDYSI
ncbi:MAG: TOBE-like domain-containing protein [Opitutaceae bacterium]|jgi:sulfate transport system ATP-binding protein|nr:TOBE-like domain-containing protein [Opitutaceae bacterium]